MRRLLATLLSAGLLLLGPLVLASGALAAEYGVTIAAATTCDNSAGNSGGLGVICDVSIVNTITATTATATVTVTECHGAAGDPRAACTTTTKTLPEAVTSVNQCNGSINGGGGTLRCSVRVEFVGGGAGATAPSVNQCVGSGGGLTTGCNPFPATTTGAMIAQCNGSANGGTLVGLTCTATGLMPAARALTVNQCNDSANGGGSLVICSANVTTSGAAASPSPSPSASAGPSASASPSPSASPNASPSPIASPSPVATVAPSTAATLPPTSTSSPTTGQPSSGSQVLLGALLLISAFALIVAARRHRGVRPDIR